MYKTTTTRCTTTMTEYENDTRIRVTSKISQHALERLQGYVYELPGELGRASIGMVRDDIPDMEAAVLRVAEMNAEYDMDLRLRDNNCRYVLSGTS